MAEPREIKTEVLVHISVLDLTCHVIFDKSFNVCLDQAFGEYKGAVLQLLLAVIPARDFVCRLICLRVSYPQVSCSSKDLQQLKNEVTP